MGNMIYALGGWNCVIAACGQVLDLNEAYNIAAGRWEIKKNGSPKRVRMHCSAG